MAEQTGISWCDHTFNPWWGCVKVSPACDNCYAERDAIRYGHHIWGKDSPRRFFTDKHWAQPHKWNAQAIVDNVRRRVFCASMADVFEDRPDLIEARQRLFFVIKHTPYLDWLLLTKRPQNMKRMLPAGFLHNVWLGTTVESPEYFWRIDALRINPAAVHFLSCEPLIEDMEGLGAYVDDIEWIIAGGESGGMKARPVPVAWYRNIRDICIARSIPFHFKQWGEHNGELVRIGRRAAGSVLDGREWKQFPQSLRDLFRTPGGKE